MMNNKEKIKQENPLNPPLEKGEDICGMELLAPAGSLEKLKIALIYGADAVYFGLPGFSLRAKASQFTKSEIREGVKFCREMGRKFFVALNIYAHNIHIDNLDKQLDFIKEIQPDGIILSDPGILRKVKEKLPKIDIHLSTQANATNKEAVRFWQEQGVKRVILAREVSLSEVEEIKKAVPEMELEYFVHGAMCMAYSGRCILSKWMLNRSANLGDCAQPCRWKYHGDYNFGKFRCQNLRESLHLQDKVNSVLCSIFPRNLLKIIISKVKTGNKNNKVNSARCPSLPRTLLKREIFNDYEEPLSLKTRIVDDKERFEMEVEEDQTGTYLFNSNDICLIEYLKELQEAGIDSIKIEGRNKSVYYVATVVRAYRKVLDVLKKENSSVSREGIDKEIQKQKKELEKLSNRGYWTGFALENEPPHLFDRASIDAREEFVGISLFEEQDLELSERKVFVHNRLDEGEKVEIVGPKRKTKAQIISIKNEKGEALQSAHGGQNLVFQIKFDRKIKGIFVMRKKI
jgi:putative protease